MAILCDLSVIVLMDFICKKKKIRRICHFIQQLYRSVGTGSTSLRHSITFVIHRNRGLRDELNS